MTKGSKPAVQKRSRATRDRLIEALDRLLRTKEFDALRRAASRGPGPERE